MRIILAKTAGFCQGVSRAVSMCEKAAEKYGDCVTLGPLIHNDSVLRKLAEKGVGVVSVLSELKPDGTVIIRSHGIGRADFHKLKESNVRIINATCPDVAKIHGIARSQSARGRLIIIFGNRGHPELDSIAGWCEASEIFETADELSKWLGGDGNRDKPISAVFQTTSTRDVFNSCSEIIKKECTNYEIFDTICDATCKRQEEAAKLAKISDAMVVIGGKSSMNSKRLAEISGKYCEKVLFIQDADELDVTALYGADTIGVTAGASTPAWIIKEVNQKMSEEIKMDGVNEETDVPIIAEQIEQAQTSEPAEQPAESGEAIEGQEAASSAAAPDGRETASSTDAPDEREVAPSPVAETFEEMLEKSIKTLHTGEKVTGVVAAITSTEVSVDLGTKQSGYIPVSEFTDESSVKIEDVVKIGDTIESFVMRVNDVEGTVMLSKKRLDAIKNWDDIEAARESRTAVEGVVTEENKGGVVVSVKGVRVFVPASQTGLLRDAPMSGLVGKTVRLRVTEVNQSRRRVVGSIRAVTFEERREKAETVWAEIEVGKKYDGVVKSMTSYGVFVDIGGVDGMIHISELSWTRISQPSEVMSVGDQVCVHVLSFDKEKKKISLGYKNLEDNPWTKFTSTLKVGDVVTVKIVKMMPFGAFAEILPGVDGLIHISQITDHRIGFPSEVLSDGQMVDVKITEIDNDRQKVSLSIRALIAPETMPGAEKEPAGEPVDNTPVIVYDTDAPAPPEDEDDNRTEE